jgi:hypothetical protein
VIAQQGAAATARAALLEADAFEEHAVIETARRHETSETVRILQCPCFTCRARKERPARVLCQPLTQSSRRSATKGRICIQTNEARV